VTPTNSGASPSIEAALDRVTRATGAAYFTAERALREGGPPASELLEQRLAVWRVPLRFRGGLLPFDRFVLQTIAAWMKEPDDVFAAAMKELDALEESKRGTPSVTPRFDVLELLLSSRYGPRLAPYVALRLLKDRWPPWKILGCLLYLKREHLAATAPALAVAAVSAPFQEARDFARKALAATVTEAKVAPALAEAQRWLAAARLAAPD
jgi:hypothetical protein